MDFRIKENNERDFFISNLVHAARINYGSAFKGILTAGSLAVLPYGSVKKTPYLKIFDKKAEKDIYCVENKGTIVFYVLFNGDRVSSFLTISKGKNDPSYFVKY